MYSIQEHPCPQDLWAVGKTLLLDHITSQGTQGSSRQPSLLRVTTPFCGSMGSQHPLSECHRSMVRCPIFHKITSGLTINLCNSSLLIRSKAKAWSFDIHICCRMITKIKITDKSLPHVVNIVNSFICVWWERLRSTLSNFQVYNTVLLTIRGHHAVY